MRNSIIPIFLSHKGCPHQCVFCDQTAIAGESVSPADVPGIIEEGLKRCAPHIPQVAFYGGSFTALPEEEQNQFLDAVRPFLNRKSVSGIRLSTRPDAIDRSVVKRLKAAGVVEVELGAQSMEDDALRAAGRGHTSADTVEAVRILQENGFSVVLQMMVGLPCERDPIYTAREIIKLSPDAVRIYPIAVVDGTPLARLWREGKYTPLTLEQGVEICADLSKLFEENHIPIIRMGLNPSETLSRAVCAGVYHPAFGELVYAKRYYRKACVLLQGVQENATIIVPRGHTSRMVGQKKENLLRLEREFGIQITVKEGSVFDMAIERASC